MAAGGTQWVPNPAGMRQVLDLPEVTGRLRADAEQIAARARSRAPTLTGAYRASIHVEFDNERGKRPRASAVADDYKANWIEFGTARMRAYRVLGSAAG